MWKFFFEIARRKFLEIGKNEGRGNLENSYAGSKAVVSEFWQK